MWLGGAESIHDLICFPNSVVHSIENSSCSSSVFPQVSLLTLKRVFDCL